MNTEPGITPEYGRMWPPTTRPQGTNFLSFSPFFFLVAVVAVIRGHTGWLWYLSGVMCVAASQPCLQKISGTSISLLAGISEVVAPSLGVRFLATVVAPLVEMFTRGPNLPWWCCALEIAHSLVVFRVPKQPTAQRTWATLIELVASHLQCWCLC